MRLDQSVRRDCRCGEQFSKRMQRERPASIEPRPSDSATA